jgi:hypothetical protein
MAETIKAKKRKQGIKSRDGSQAILLEEYQALHEDYLHQRSEGVTRVNFYITAMSVILGGTLVFGSSDNPLIIVYLRPVLISATILLFVIGRDVYHYLVQRDLATDRAIRGMARVRHYFVKSDPSLKEHFINNVYDTPSGYLVAKNSGMRRTTEMILGFLLGIALAVVSSYFFTDIFLCFVVGAFSSIITALAFEMMARKKLDKALQKAEKDIRFNNPKLL